MDRDAIVDLNRHFEEFSDKFRALLDSGTILVIGGMWALRLHGLKTRVPQDLDIIVYHPNEKLKAFLLQYPEDADYPEKWPKVFGEKQRSFKFHKELFTLNVVVEHEEKVGPGDFLIFHSAYVLNSTLPSNGDMLVQSIDRVLAAKRSYSRDKDWADLEELYNLNLKR